MLTLIKNAEVFAPEALGSRDILLGGGRILAVEPEIDLSLKGVVVETVDGSGLAALPGLVDTHVHICGGGGEGGFETRTPEIVLSSLLKAGVTAVVGVLGTDGVTRTPGNLLAKAAGLTREGVDTWVLTGSYEIPVRTVTGSVTDDIVLIDRIIGVGEICLSDHRSSHPSSETLAGVISAGRLGGMLSGKAGIVNIHMGDGKEGLAPLREVLEHTDLPLSQLQPTHMNRNRRLFEEGVEYALQGGYVDFTTSTTPRFIEEGELPAARALKLMLDRGVDISRISFSSDAQGSLPLFDGSGNLTGLTVGECSSLLVSLREAVFDLGIPLELAARAVTSNPAGRYGLSGKGRIRPGYDGDILLLHRKDLSLSGLYSRGEVMVRQGELLRRGVFEGA